ncbi:hypothetical protein SCP_1101650 [Sparassis crispa]|uniref:DUF6533 domain-containing protein n=1 Tax=Sparassis crispa TaxID=139825 RepID=A0A401GZA1_9APHY|nr:hypothetical protein SCP_1101650 [Sparassis crispa]GBE87488.1 hypothetical protein SCP_1101650 [Sparassis crispa]
MSETFSMQEVYLHNYLHLVGISIFYYDYLITFRDEYSRIWSKPKSKVSIMFFVNRYVTFFGDIAVNWGNFYHFKTDERFIHTCMASPIDLNLLLRTYALYRRDKRVLALILATGLTLLGLSCWAVIGSQEDIDLNGGCHTAAPRVTAIRTAVAWEALFIYDILIFSLTVFKTFKERSRNVVTVGKFDVVSLIFRDGAMYFAIMASVNLANVVTFYVLTPLLRGVLSTFASSVSVTMMTRLMLNLHEGIYAPSTTLNPSTENSTTLLFTSRFAIDAAQVEESALQGADRNAYDDPDADPDEIREVEIVEMHDMQPRRRNRDADEVV